MHQMATSPGSTAELGIYDKLKLTGLPISRFKINTSTISSGLLTVVCHLPPRWETMDVMLNLDGITLNLHSCAHLQSLIEGKRLKGDSLPGNFCIEPRQQTFRYAWESDEELVAVKLSPLPSLFQRTIAEISSIDPEQVRLIGTFNHRDPLLEHLARALSAEVETGGLFGLPYHEALAHTLILHLLRHYSSIHPCLPDPQGHLSQQQIRKVRDYIYDHLDQEVSLAEMAALLNLSISHFSHLFKETTGLSPYQYVIQCRIERAKHLLLDPALSIADVAQRVGFTDQSHLHRHFRRILGSTPARLREELMRKQEYTITAAEYTIQQPQEVLH
ncbi:MAG: helix-turn-helix transcriptional regulator [Ktedonobacteraceae bacterium]|nr:helix-turn-helix transcriptional regulator [Ktedonobacteraceae bacterium]